MKEMFVGAANCLKINMKHETEAKKMSFDILQHEVLKIRSFNLRAGIKNMKK